MGVGGTPGLSNDIQCHDHTCFLCLQISRSDIRPHEKWALSHMAIADGHLIFLMGCVHMYGLTTVYHRRGSEFTENVVNVSLCIMLHGHINRNAQSVQVL